MTAAAGGAAFTLNPCTVASQMQLDALLRMGLTMFEPVRLTVAGGTLTISNPQLLAITCPDGRIDFRAPARFDSPQLSTSGVLRAISPAEVRLTLTGQGMLCLTSLNVVELNLQNAPGALSDMIRSAVSQALVCIDVTPVISGFLGGI